MVTVLVVCRVADFDSWRPGYVRDVDALSALRSFKVWRGQDDPNLVAIVETYESREVAEAILTSPEVAEAMARDGVDASSVQVHFLDEVTSGGH
jgi:quinol monooxygenase YgiN